MEKTTMVFEVIMVVLVLLSITSFLAGLYIAPTFFTMVGTVALILLGIVAVVWIGYILYSYSKW